MVLPPSRSRESMTRVPVSLQRGQRMLHPRTGYTSSGTDAEATTRYGNDTFARRSFVTDVRPRTPLVQRSTTSGCGARILGRMCGPALTRVHPGRRLAVFACRRWTTGDPGRTSRTSSANPRLRLIDATCRLQVTDERERTRGPGRVLQHRDRGCGASASACRPAADGPASGFRLAPG